MRILILLLAAVVAGCTTYEKEDAIFVAYNVCNDNVAVLVNDGEEVAVLANRSIRFIVEVLVPKPAFGTTGPSSVDRQVQVSVAFRNLRTGKLTSPIFCQAGAKVVTHVWYEVFPGGYESARCYATY